MDVNREQHGSFHDGIQELEDYVNSALREKEFNGNRVITIIDGFGELVREHLTNEIDSLLSLGQYGDKLSGLKEALDQEAKKNMVRCPSWPFFLFLRGNNWSNAE